MFIFQFYWVNKHDQKIENISAKDAVDTIDRVSQTMERVSALKYNYEYSIDAIHDMTDKIIQIFVEHPYNFTATFQKTNIGDLRELYLLRQSERTKIQKPTFDRKETIDNYEKMMVSKEWADNCLKIIALENQLTLLKNDAVKNMPDELKKK